MVAKEKGLNLHSRQGKSICHGSGGKNKQKDGGVTHTKGTSHPEGHFRSFSLLRFRKRLWIIGKRGSVLLPFRKELFPHQVGFGVVQVKAPL